MSGDDRHDDESEADDPTADADPDRVAILARRRRFMAIALSGLTTAACDEPASKPDACLKVKVSDPKEPKGDPQPCLKVDIATTGADDGRAGGSSSGGDDDAKGSTSAGATPCLEVAPPPRPCLSPRPCLKVAPPPEDPKPRPCLKVRPKPKPRPCLNVAPPENLGFDEDVE